MPTIAISSFYDHFNNATVILVALSLILFSGFLVTRLTKLAKLPNVTGYILAGILLGPCVLNAVPRHVIHDMGFVSDIALAFIAFGVAKFFKKEVMKQTGAKIVVVTVAEALLAGILIMLFMHWVLNLDWLFSMLLGAIATATAPASTMMTINQYRAKGEFVNTLLQVVALDDVICLLAFSAVMALENTRGEVSLAGILLPIVYNFAALGIGFLCGLILSKLLTPQRSRENRLILALAMLLGISGLCDVFEISPLLACMVFGATYINLTRDKTLFKQINRFTPPVMSIFFIVSGMSFDLRILGSVGLIGVSYFLIRIAGKYLGAYFGCAAVGSSREIKNYLGLALIPQAGVAIGLAFMGQRILSPEVGNTMLTIVLASSILYELIGPAAAKLALFKSGAIPRNAVRLPEVEPQSTIELPRLARRYWPRRSIRQPAPPQPPPRRPKPTKTPKVAKLQKAAK